MEADAVALGVAKVGVVPHARWQRCLRRDHSATVGDDPCEIGCQIVSRVEIHHRAVGGGHVSGLTHYGAVHRRVGAWKHGKVATNLLAPQAHLKYGFIKFHGALEISGSVKAYFALKLTVGIFMITGGNSLAQVVNTQGMDIPHMTQAIQKLGTAFKIRVIATIVGLVLILGIFAFAMFIFVIAAASSSP